MPKEEDRNRAEKTHLIHSIVKDIARGKASPYKMHDKGLRGVMSDLYHLDLKTLQFLHQIHQQEEEKMKQ